jgi:hypothetical protein
VTDRVENEYYDDNIMNLVFQMCFLDGFASKWHHSSTKKLDQTHDVGFGMRYWPHTMWASMRFKTFGN